MRVEMPHTIVLGGGLCGLTAAMMLARDGHRVTVLERDADPLPADPESAWERWNRLGVAQFRQSHYLQPLGRAVLEAELPDVLEAFKAAGALRFDPLAVLPGPIADREPRKGDERFVTWTARRSTLEQVIGRAAENEPGVSIQRGVSAVALETAVVDGHLHVSAVRTDRGDRLAGDLVIDAMGRGSALPKLLAAAGGVPVAEESEDSGFLYYTRFFRGTLPERRGPINAPVGSFSVLTLPADADTWSVTLYGSSRDRPLKALRDPARWTALLSACPLHAQWLDGEPITPVMPMGGILDRRRSLNGSTPTGVLSVADAWACTNPSMGRGISLGLAHVALLRRVVRESLERPAELRLAYAAATESVLAPWYDSTVLIDRARMAEIEALRTGVALPAPSAIGARVGAALPLAMSRDADVFRAGLEITACLALPRDVFSRPGLAERVLARAAEGPGTPFGPDRAGLLAILG